MALPRSRARRRWSTTPRSAVHRLWPRGASLFPLWPGRGVVGLQPAAREAPRSVHRAGEARRQGEPRMEYRKLGRGRLKVPAPASALMFRGPAGEADSAHDCCRSRRRHRPHRHRRRLQRRQVEEVVGRAIGNERDRWVTAEAEWRHGRGAESGGSSRKWIFEAARRGLGRLGRNSTYRIRAHLPQAPRRRRSRRSCARVRRPRAGTAHDPLLRAVVKGVAHRRDLATSARCVGTDRPVATACRHALNRMAEVEQFPAAPYLRPGRRALQPRWRRPVGQVRAGCRAARRQHARRARMPADEPNGGPEVARDRSRSRPAPRGARHDRQPSRRGLGAGERLVTSVICGPHRGAAHGLQRRPRTSAAAPTGRWSTAWWSGRIRRRLATATLWSRRGRPAVARLGPRV